MTNADADTDTGKKISITSILVCVIVLFLYCYEYYLKLIITKFKYSFSTISAEVHSSSYYFISLWIILQIPAGILIDYYGTKKILVLTCFLSIVSSYLLDSYGLRAINISEGLIALSSTFAYLSLLKTIINWVPDRYFTFFVCISGSVIALLYVNTKTVIVLTEQINWHVLFQEHIIWNICIAILIFIILHNNQSNLKSTKVSRPTIPLAIRVFRLITKQQIWVLGMIGGLIAISKSIPIWVPYFGLSGMNKYNSSIAAYMIFLGFSVGCPLLGVFYDNMKKTKLIIIIPSLIAAVITIIIFCFTKYYYSKYIIYLLMFLLGTNLGPYLIVITICKDLTPTSLNATALALTNMIILIVVQLLNILIKNIYIMASATTNITNVNAYTMSLLILPVCSIIGSIIAFKYVRDKNS